MLFEKVIVEKAAAANAATVFNKTLRLSIDDLTGVSLPSYLHDLREL